MNQPKVGDEVIIEPGVFYNGWDLSYRRAIIKSLNSYCLVDTLGTIELKNVKLLADEFRLAPSTTYKSSWIQY